MDLDVDEMMMMTAMWINIFHQVVFTVTGGIVWIVFVWILGRVFLPISVFVYCILHIANIRVPFIVIIFCTIGAFSLMYFTVMNTSGDGVEYCMTSAQSKFTGTTTVTTATATSDVDSSASFCTLEGSFFHIFNMFIGVNPSSLVFVPNDEYKYAQQSILSPLFAFMVIVLFLNILIATVNHSYAKFYKKGEELFWWLRLQYVTEVENALEFLRCRLFCWVASFQKVKSKPLENATMNVDEMLYRYISVTRQSMTPRT